MAITQLENKKAYFCFELFPFNILTDRVWESNFFVYLKYNVVTCCSIISILSVFLFNIKFLVTSVCCFCSIFAFYMDKKSCKFIWVVKVNLLNGAKIIFLILFLLSWVSFIDCHWCFYGVLRANTIKWCALNSHLDFGKEKQCPPC